MKGSNRAAACLSGWLVLSLGCAAMAEPRATEAETLFREGKQLLKNRDHEAACAKLEASYKLEPASGTLLGMAICHEALGKLASAWFDYRMVLERAQREGRADREHAARHALAELTPRLSTLVLLVPNSVQPLTVTCDGKRFEDLSSPHPIDPGQHQIEVSSPGMLTFTTEVNVTAQGQSVVVTVPKLIAGSSPELAAQASSSKAIGKSTPVRFLSRFEVGLDKATTSRRDASAEQGVPRWFWTTFGLGAVATSTSLVFAGLAWDKKASLNCPDNHCPSSRQNDVDTYHDLRSGCLIGLAVGVSALATGFILSLYGPDPAPPTRSTALRRSTPDPS